MVSVADSAAVVVGVKVTLRVQFAPAARVAGLIGHAVAPVLVSVKSDALAPANEILLIVRATFAPLVRVTVLGALMVLTAWLPKGSDAGATETVPATEAAENLVTKASSKPLPPPMVIWKGVLEVGKSLELVPPVRYTLGGEEVSRAIPA